LFLPVKNSYGPLGTGLAFKMQEARLGNEITTTAITFESEPVIMTAKDALRALAATPDQRSALDEAKRFWLDILHDGPRLANDIDREARAARISDATLRRARAALNICRRKESKGGWVCSLPDR
jgi:hypothetical protein